MKINTEEIAFEEEIKSFFSEEIIIEATSQKATIESLTQTLKASNNGFVTQRQANDLNATHYLLATFNNRGSHEKQTSTACQPIR